MAVEEYWFHKAWLSEDWFACIWSITDCVGWLIGFSCFIIGSIFDPIPSGWMPAADWPIVGLALSPLISCAPTTPFTPTPLFRSGDWLPDSNVPSLSFLSESPESTFESLFFVCCSRLNFILRFWNQTLTWRSVRSKFAAISILRGLNSDFYLNALGGRSSSYPSKVQMKFLNGPSIKWFISNARA